MLLVLDVTLPGLSGLELRSSLPSGRHADHLHHRARHVPMTVQAMKAGAVNPEKPSHHTCCWTPSTAPKNRAKFASRLRQESEMRVLRSSYASLTPREREVIGVGGSGVY